MKILMCRPEYYGIQYEINPWMKVQQAINYQQAVSQWEVLYQTLLSCGAAVDLISPIKGWPDMVFTANAGLFFQGKIILSHFKHKERQGEQPYFKAWFQDAGFEFWNDPTASAPYFEGAGDALAAGNKLFVGFGFRSDRYFYEQAAYLKNSELIFCELCDPYYYHIDTCFCPLNDKLAIWYPPAFTKKSQEHMFKEIEFIPVIENEAKKFACNAVVLDNHVVLPANCPQISSELEKRGFIVHACDMSEYLKAGGACKCLTLRID
ncbi:MAG: amidinotransferase [Gammaproteobacteria bacterium]|nr:amidinotransferase [Gammaproteobacteria bacterium]MCW5584281.1 amidinotransferase [Gammaproteobacteria bacterium]